jgi:hypothetical protein
MTMNMCYVVLKVLKPQYFSLASTGGSAVLEMLSSVGQRCQLVRCFNGERRE